MAVYLVTYDLNALGQRYKALYEELKTSPSWWHYLDSTWLIHTAETPDQLYERIRPALDANDYILVMKVCNSAQGWLPKDAWDWINKYVPNC